MILKMNVKRVWIVDPTLSLVEHTFPKVVKFECGRLQLSKEYQPGYVLFGLIQRESISSIQVKIQTISTWSMNRL